MSISLEDIGKIVIAVLASVGGVGGLIIAFSRYIGRVFADKYIERVKADFEKEVAQHKSQLELLLKKAEKLHSTRFEKIEILFKKLIDLDEKMRAMTARLKLVSLAAEIEIKNENNRIDEAGKSYNDFHDFYRANRFFFTDASCKVIDKLHQAYNESLHTYIDGRRYEEPQLITEASKKVYQEIPPVLKQLENELRSIIDIDHKND